MSYGRSSKAGRDSFLNNVDGRPPPELAPSGKPAREFNSRRTLPRSSTRTESYEVPPEEPESPLQLAQRQLYRASRELLEVQNYIKTVDDYTPVDISQRLTDIQELNNNLSKHVYDWNSLKRRWWSFPVSLKRRRQLGRCINPDFVLFLSSIPLEDEERTKPLLRFAWKAIVSRGIFLILEPYSLAFRPFSGSANLVEPQESNPIVSAANNMRDTIPEVVYAKWRALTYRFVRESSSDNITNAVEALSKSITLLLFASICLPSQPHRPSYKTFRARYEQEVEGILKEAVKLAKMIQEGVVTREYRPLHPSFGRPIDKDAMTLENRADLLPDGEKDAVALEDDPDLLLGDDVFCVTQPGLIQVGGDERVLKRASVLSTSTFHKIVGEGVPSISFSHKSALLVDGAIQRIVSPFCRDRMDPNFTWP